MDRRRAEPVHHRSGSVWCSQFGREATVSIVERDTSLKLIRYVQWCSLGGLQSRCAGECVQAVPPLPGGTALPVELSARVREVVALIAQRAADVPQPGLVPWRRWSRRFLAGVHHKQSALAAAAAARHAAGRCALDNPLRWLALAAEKAATAAAHVDENAELARRCADTARTLLDASR